MNFLDQCECVEFSVDDNGKHCRYPKGKRRYLKKPDPSWKNYGVKYPFGYFKFDVDDRDHKHGILVDPIHGKPRSDFILEKLHEQGIFPPYFITPHGKQIIFKRRPDQEIKNADGICYANIRCEWKFPESDDHIPILIYGEKRELIDGDKEPPVLPVWLMYSQRNRNKKKKEDYDMNFEEGARTNPLGGYVLHLTGNKGLTQEEAFQVIEIINDSFDHPISDSDLYSQTLNDSTAERCKQNEQDYKDQHLSHVQIGQEVIEHFNIIISDGQMYQYKNGVYLPVVEEAIGKYIRHNHPSIKRSQREEAISYVEDMTYIENIDKDHNFINVKNGLLSINTKEKKVLHIPHSKDIKSFNQFNVVYDPEVKSQMLDSTLEKFFDGVQEQIILFKQMLGYILMDNTIYQKCFFFVGKPSSGKSKILNMISAFCGKDFVSNLSLKELDDKYRPSTLIGKTVNINADLEKAKILSSGNFKSLVTGDAITMERKYGKPFSYISTTKLIFASNQFPDFSRDSEGIFRRVLIFPCNHVFKKTDPDFNPRIDDDLQAPETMTALLNMAIEGYFSLVENGGFIATEMTEKASESFKVETDNVFQWIKECEIEESYLLREPIKSGIGGLYNDYRSFCFDSGQEPKDQKDFSRTICSEYGFETHTKRIKVTKERSQFFRKK